VLWFLIASVLNCFLEKALCGCDVSVLAQQKVNRVALIIDSTIEILPFTANPDVSLFHSRRPTDRASEIVPLLVELRDVVLYTSEDSSMSQINATLGHQAAEIAIAEFVGDVPPQVENND
jgi:hypothetical protein